MRRPLLLIALLSASLVPCIAATDGVPVGWFLAGDHPQNYRTGVDGNGTAFLTSKLDVNAAGGFGTLMQSVKADAYAGRRVRFSAMVRSEDVKGWAGLWMRVDQGSKTLALDNMETRPIKGTNGWMKYEVVLNVPINATGISFGALVDSNGEVWLSHVSFAVVNSDMPTSGQWPFGEKPKNLDFRQ
jgi:hypothetical protein